MGEATCLRWPTAFGGSFRSKLSKLIDYCYFVGFGDVLRQGDAAGA